MDLSSMLNPEAEEAPTNNSGEQSGPSTMPAVSQSSGARNVTEATLDAPMQLKSIYENQELPAQMKKEPMDDNRLHEVFFRADSESKPTDPLPSREIAHFNEEMMPAAVNSIDEATARAIAEAQNQFGTRIRGGRQTEKGSSPTPVPSLPKSVSKKRPAPRKATRPKSKKRKTESNLDRNTPISQRRSTSAAGSVADSDEDADSTDDNAQYCICRGPDDHTFMICCEECGEWYHGRCIHIKKEDELLMDKFACPPCEEAGKAVTLWVPLCRRDGCRNKARVRDDDGKQLHTPSKYCSDQCGIAFMQQKMGQSNIIGSYQRRRPNTPRKDEDTAMGNTEDTPQIEELPDLSTLGGRIRNSELKVLVNNASNAEDFKHLGISGLLTPPPSTSAGEDLEPEIQYTDIETKRLAEIAERKAGLRERRTLLKDRERFVQLAKERAVSRSKEKETKDQCGFDPRLSWDEPVFAAWRTSTRGEAVFQQNKLDAKVNEGIQEGAQVVDETGLDLCTRGVRSCGRHLGWQKIVLQDVRFEEADVGDEMRRIDREERTIRDRARLRVREAGFEGVDLDNGRCVEAA